MNPHFLFSRLSSTPLDEKKDARKENEDEGIKGNLTCILEYSLSLKHHLKLSSAALTESALMLLLSLFKKCIIIKQDTLLKNVRCMDYLNCKGKT